MICLPVYIKRLARLLHYTPHRMVLIAGKVCIYSISIYVISICRGDIIVFGRHNAADEKIIFGRSSDFPLYARINKCTKKKIF
jgi:hypothetical protein